MITAGLMYWEVSTPAKPPSKFELRVLVLLKETHDKSKKGNFVEFRFMYAVQVAEKLWPDSEAWVRQPQVHPVRRRQGRGGDGKTRKQDRLVQEVLLGCASGGAFSMRLRRGVVAHR